MSSFQQPRKEGISMTQDVTMAVDGRLLDWIRQRVQETTEKGSIYLSIEQGRLTRINYEKNNQYPPVSSSGGMKSYDCSKN